MKRMQVLHKLNYSYMYSVLQVCILQAIDLVEIKCLLDCLFAASPLSGHVTCFVTYIFNTTALRKAKIVHNFGLSECNRVNDTTKGKISNSYIRKFMLT